MKIAWFCIPAHGHINPTLKLVKELTEAGHEIYYFSFKMFKEKLENVGAHVIECDSYDIDMEDKDNAERVSKDIAFATELLVSSTLALDDMISKNIATIKPDIIISDSVAYWGKLTAIKYNIPYVCSTTTFAFNESSSKYFKRGIKELLKMLFALPKVNKQLNRLKENGYPVKSILDIIQNDNNTNSIVYTSSYFQPCSETFSDKYHFIGASIRPIQEEMPKTAEKTIYISMGTVNKNKKFYENCIEVFSNTDYQVIISKGTEKTEFNNLPENIKVFDSVDQMAVLSIADVFITHCGMNSVSEGLYFEVPLALFPQTQEQGVVALRTEELGAGIQLKSIHKKEILDTVQELLTNPKYKENAKLISKSFKEAGGVKEAKEFIETIVKK